MFKVLIGHNAISAEAPTLNEVARMAHGITMDHGGRALVLAGQDIPLENYTVAAWVKPLPDGKWIIAFELERHGLLPREIKIPPDQTSKDD